ncbi:TPA: hypothetical protein DCL30_04805 [Candidatus Peribacteria bacterium]|nr:MAG: hypothetical protein A2529_04865 [Candidatus Peribacteria bacterium RIFOXYD2_FULL_58_15]HAI98822.1 hypothetical protein [Candidatus Peribacteria bacterium]HAS34056.1 hypothetical protein [Candidatus Peribacteria bacterium]
MSSLLRRRWMPLVIGALCVGLIALMLWPLENAPFQDDGIRHLTLARLMAERGIGAFTGWGDFFFTGYFTHHNSDPWFLSEVLLLPLAGFPLVTGIKWFIVLSSALLAVIMIFAFRALKVPSGSAAILIVLLLFGELGFFLRLFLARPFILISCVLVLVILAIVRRQTWALLPLLALAVLLSHLFIFPLIASCIGVLWLLSVGDVRRASMAALSIILGIGLGLLLHPQAPAYLHYLFTVFLQPVFSQQMSHGTELLGGFGLGSHMAEPAAGAAILLGACAFSCSKVPLRTLHERGVTFTAFIVVGLLAAFWLWARSIEMLWPVLILLIGQIIGLAPSAPALLLQKILPARFTTGSLAVCALLIIAANNIETTSSYLLREDPRRSLAPVAEALKDIEPGAHVLNTLWDTFAMLFAVRPDLTYATAMDSSFTAIEDQTGSLLLDVTRDRTFAFPDPIISASSWLRQTLDRFPSAQYLVLPTKNRSFVQALSALPSLERIASNEVIAVFRVRNKG